MATSASAEGENTYSPVSLDTGSKLYWDDLGGINANLKLIGIYPYKDLQDNYKYSGNNIEWTVTKDINASDLLLANPNPYLYDKINAANLLFEHVLTKVSINLFEGKGFDIDEDEDKKLDLSKAIVTFTVPTEGNCDVTTGVAIGTNKTTGKLIPDKVGDSFTILTFPFSVGSEETYKLAVITIGGNTYNVNVKGLDLQKGVHNIFNVTIDKSDVTFTASIIDWDKTPEPIDESAKLVEVGDFTIDDDKVEVNAGTIINLAITDKNSIVHKRTFTYNGTGWELLNEQKPLYWDDMAYPFTSVEALMILGGNINKDIGDNIFSASIKDVPLGEAIDLGEFKHPLVKLTITVTTTIPSEIVTNNVNLAGITEVKINQSTLFEVDGATIYEDNSTSLTAVNDGKGTYTYVAFMMPKKLTKLCDITIDEDEDSKNINKYPVTFETETPFEAGKHYEYTVTITKTNVELTGSLVDWIPGGGGDIGTGLE